MTTQINSSKNNTSLAAQSLQLYGLGGRGSAQDEFSSISNNNNNNNEAYNKAPSTAIMDDYKRL